MEYKLIMMGEGGVGKSAITIRYIQDHFIVEYDPTIEDSYRKQVTIDDETCLLDILDTAGREEFYYRGAPWIRKAHTILIIYAVDSKISFDAVQSHYDEIIKAKELTPKNDIPIVLVGNKCDLEKERTHLHRSGEAFSCSAGMSIL